MTNFKTKFIKSEVIIYEEKSFSKTSASGVYRKDVQENSRLSAYRPISGKVKNVNNKKRRQ